MFVCFFKLGSCRRFFASVPGNHVKSRAQEWCGNAVLKMMTLQIRKRRRKVFQIESAKRWQLTNEINGGLWIVVVYIQHKDLYRGSKLRISLLFHQSKWLLISIVARIKRLMSRQQNWLIFSIQLLYIKPLDPSQFLFKWF